MAVLVALIVAIGSCTTLAQLSCHPGAPGATCRPMKKADELHCIGSDFNDCLERCCGSTLDLSTSGSNCCEGSHTNNGNLNVTYQLLPWTFGYFNLSIQLPSASGVKENMYNLELKLSRFRSVCACTNETTFNFTVEYHKRQQRPLILKVRSFPSRLSFYTSIPYPQHCADFERGVPYNESSCGLPRLQKPTNIVLRCNETHTHISWNKSITYIKPDRKQSILTYSEKFYLTVTVSDNTKFDFIVFNTDRVTLNTTAAMNITLYGYEDCSGLQEYFTLGRPSLPAVGCSHPAITSNRSPRTCCGNSTCGKSPTVSTVTPMFTPTPLPSAPREYHSLAVEIIVLPIVALAIIIAIALILLIIFIRRQIHPSLSEKISPSLLKHSALTVYSSSTPDRERLVIMQGFAGIATLQDTRLPQQSLVEWIMEHFENTHTVFCVCNREFKADWENSGPPSEDTVVAVQTLRLLFEGDLKSVEPKKYAVVLSKPTDEAFVPSLLKTLPCINLSDTPTLVQFAA